MKSLNSPVTTFKTLLLKFGSTVPSSDYELDMLPGIASAIQSGRTNPTILLTSIISYQINGTYLNPTLGFKRSAKILNVSDGFGSHLPGPCSEQVGPLERIVPAGNKNSQLILKILVHFFELHQSLQLMFDSSKF